MVNGFQGTKPSVFWILESPANPVFFLFKFSADPEQCLFELGSNFARRCHLCLSKLIDWFVHGQTADAPVVPPSAIWPPGGSKKVM